VVSNERAQLLETGGGLVKALPLIDADPFLVVNSDNLWVDGPVDSLRLLASGWDDEHMDALLLLVPIARANCHNGQGDFHMNATGRLRRRTGGVAPFVYTGIQMVSKRLFEGEVPDGPFSTNILWDRAIEAGRCYGSVHQGLWFDVGAPPNILKAEQILGHS
jgi:MurNAc alpha-1-phosphate uridylyltransferase